MSNLEKMVMGNTVTLVLRDREGHIKAIRKGHNMKVYGTMNIIASMLFNAPTTDRTVNKLGLGSANGIASADTALSGEVGPSRTLGRFSHDAGSAMWNLSWSQTAWAASTSIYQAGIFDSYTGGNLYLKTTFLQLTVMSQDILNVAWLQSLASA